MADTTELYILILVAVALIFSQGHKEINKNFFNLGIMADTTELYILILIAVALIFSQGHKEINKNFFTNYLSKFSKELDCHIVIQ